MYDFPGGFQIRNFFQESHVLLIKIDSYQTWVFELRLEHLLGGFRVLLIVQGFMIHSKDEYWCMMYACPCNARNVRPAFKSRFYHGSGSQYAVEIFACLYTILKYIFYLSSCFHVASHNPLHLTILAYFNSPNILSHTHIRRRRKKSETLFYCYLCKVSWLDFHTLSITWS